MAKESCYYSGAKEFNNLPTETNSINSLLVFKARKSEMFIGFIYDLLYLVNIVPIECTFV